MHLSDFIDSGASRTVIADADAQRIDIDYSRLSKAPENAIGIGGEVDIYTMSDCMLIFEFKDSVFVEYPDTISVLKSPTKTKKQREHAKALPSLLGLDVLHNYSITFTPKSVILER